VTSIASKLTPDDVIPAEGLTHNRHLYRAAKAYVVAFEDYEVCSACDAGLFRKRQGAFEAALASLISVRARLDNENAPLLQKEASK